MPRHQPSAFGNGECSIIAASLGSVA